MSAKPVTADPWRLACPKGHRDVRGVRRTSYRCDDRELWRCNTCECTYETVTDLRTNEEVKP